MDKSIYENLSHLMVERNISLSVIQALSRRLEMKEIDQSLYELVRAKYIAKLESLDIQLSKRCRNLSCSKCQQSFEDDEQIICCINCGFPFHQSHLDESSIENRNFCPNCGSIFQAREIDGFQTIELKKIEYFSGKLRSKISIISVKIDGKPLRLKREIPHKTEVKKFKTGKESINCPNCGQKANVNWKYCKKCGFLLKKLRAQKDKKKCTNCGTILNPSWRFCKWCGASTGF